MAVSDSAAPQAVVVRRTSTTAVTTGGGHCAAGAAVGGECQQMNSTASNTRQRVGSGPRFSVAKMESMLTSTYSRRVLCTYCSLYSKYVYKSTGTAQCHQV